MALLSKLFKPDLFKAKWQHNDPEVRRQAISELQSRELLLEIIDSEEVAELRQLAVQNLNLEADLERLLSHNKADIRECARQHWLKTLLTTNNPIDQINDNQILIRIASLTEDQDQRLAAISRITDQHERLQLAMSNPVAKVRLAAAQGVTDADKLQQLQNYAQGKDKAVYRLCKERLNASKAKREAEQVTASKINALLASAQQLNRLGYNPEFNGRYQVFSKEWNSLKDQASNEQQNQINAELSKAAEVLNQHAEQEIRQAEVKAAAEQAQQQQTELLTQLDALLHQAIADVPDNLHDQLVTLELKWHETASLHKATGEQLRQFENQLQQLFAIHTAISHYHENQQQLTEWLEQKLPTDMRGLTQIRNQAQQWQKQLHWPIKESAPSWITAIANRLQQANAQLDDFARQQKSRLKIIDEQLLALEAALEQGHAKDAGKISQQLQQNLRQVDNKAVQSQQRQTKALIARLNEMRDWQGFATTPKKEALCAEMERLIGAEINADVLADKIHDLQDQWKTLGSSQPDRELWQRFQAAGDKAFEPCREYFAQVAEKRQQFVAARRTLTAELLNYEQQLNWESADWKAVQKTLDAARDTFRQYSPVDRAAHKETQAEFQSACDAIYAHLKAEYDRNLDTKKALTNEAEQLIHSEDLSAAIERIKQLQNEWKHIGVTPRNPDQKLWKQFRNHCDALFARLDSEKAQRKAVISDAVDSAEKIVTDAEALTTQKLEDMAAISDAQNALVEYKQQFADIELPKSAHQRLVKKFQSLENTLKDKRQQLTQAAEKARWNGLIDRLNAITHNDVDAFTAAAELPAGYSDALFQQALAGELKHDYDARTVVIAMEVLANLESPESDKSLRMELQVQKLAQGLGQGQSKEDERQQLVEQWLQAESKETLHGRFIEALQASL